MTARAQASVIAGVPNSFSSRSTLRITKSQGCEPPIDVPLGRLDSKSSGAARFSGSLQVTGNWFCLVKWLMPPRSNIMIDCRGCCRVAPSAP